MSYVIYPYIIEELNQLLAGAGDARNIRNRLKTLYSIADQDIDALIEIRKQMVRRDLFRRSHCRKHCMHLASREDDSTFRDIFRCRKNHKNPEIFCNWPSYQTKCPHFEVERPDKKNV